MNRLPSGWAGLEARRTPPACSTRPSRSPSISPFEPKGGVRESRHIVSRMPEPALWVFDTIGLAVFIGCVGLGAGPSFVAGLRETGPSLLVVGLVVALVPHTTAVLFGRYVLKMNPVLLLGACAGAGTATAALRAVQDEAGSKLPVLGYTVPYAIGNILLTAWGPVIVMLTR